MQMSFQLQELSPGTKRTVYISETLSSLEGRGGHSDIVYASIINAFFLFGIIAKFLHKNMSLQTS